MKPLLLVGIGGAAGSMLRFLLQRWLNEIIFPYGTLCVNLTGCLLIGILAGLSMRNGISQPMVFLTMSGFCGGFTTLSAFSLESLQLLQQNRMTTFLLYAVFTIILGIATTFIGYKITS